jgi:predicted transcriptional regulator
LYRIGVRLAGADPRVALRQNATLGDEEAAQLERKLAAMGARSQDGPWAMAILQLIEKRPGVLAARLAKSIGMDTAVFKPRVRQLKELGLTESLEIGYRLSPRGTALLRRLDASKAG